MNAETVRICSPSEWPYWALVPTGDVKKIEHDPAASIEIVRFPAKEQTRLNAIHGYPDEPQRDWGKGPCPLSDQQVSEIVRAAVYVREKHNIILGETIARAVREAARMTKEPNDKDFDLGMVYADRKPDDDDEH